MITFIIVRIDAMNVSVASRRRSFAASLVSLGLDTVQPCCICDLRYTMLFPTAVNKSVWLIAPKDWNTPMYELAYSLRPQLVFWTRAS